MAIYKFSIRHFFGFMIFGLLALFSTQQLIYLPTDEDLSGEYEADDSSLVAFVPNQTIIVKNRYSNTGVTMYRSVNVGVSKEGLHLHEPVFNIFVLPSFIPWNELEYQKHIPNSNKNEPFTFYIKKSKNSIRLYPHTIDRLEKQYGKTIFSNKLGVLSD